MMFGLTEEELVKFLKDVLVILVILFLTYIFSLITRRVLKGLFIRTSKITKVNPERYSFLVHIMSALVYLVGIFIVVYLIPPLKTIAVSLLAGAGILAIVIGFASQQAFSNIISGVMIAIFKPIRVGDRVKIGTDITGIVEDITLRHTVIRSFENKRLIIPNSKMSEETIENSNYLDEKICRFIDVGISYDSDINLAMKIMREEAMKHPNIFDNRTKKEKDMDGEVVSVKVLGFGDSSVNLRAWVWAKSPSEGFNMHCDLNKSIKERFDLEGIEIPFPYRTLVYKKDIEKISKRRKGHKKK